MKKLGKSFSGVWGTYEYLDDMCAAITRLRNSGFEKITTVSPCPRHEIADALGNPESRVPFFTLVTGIVGLFTGFLLCSWMSLDWVLPVSSKPILSVLPFTVIGFELTILFGVYGTIAGIAALAIKDTLANPTPRSERYKEYTRFSRDRFGIVVPCADTDLEVVEELMNEFHAEEVVREN